MGYQLKGAGMTLSTFQQMGVVQTPEGSRPSMICFDEDLPNEAIVHIWSSDRSDPPTAALFDLQWTSQDRATMIPRVRFAPHQKNGEISPMVLTVEQSSEFFAFRASLVIQKNKSLRGSWTGSNGKKGTFKYRASLPTDQRVIATQCESWGAFKSWATRSRDEGGAAIFRGHGNSQFRLTTTLHRGGRTRLERYCSETLHTFKAHVEAILGIRIDMFSGDDYSMLLGLAQHHGLPTPLLDWSDSPYVASFFAFSDALESAATRPSATHVRIYALTKAFIDANFSQTVVLPYMTPYIAPLTISARMNPRLYAQQGKFLVTNIADLERHFCETQTRQNLTALTAADVPISCAGEALQDLKFMGLTAATMFPGLDGVGRMMRHEMSFRRPISRPSGKPSPMPIDLVAED